jgi:hypothetical protein
MLKKVKRLTGTTKSVDRKWQRYEIKYGSELRCFPSTSIVRGSSGTKLNAALKHASTGGEKETKIQNYI